MPEPAADTLLAPPSRLERLRAEAATLPSFPLDEAGQADLELLLNGGYAPLNGYAAQEECDGILSDMRLANGAFWPIPILLPVSRQSARDLAPGMRVCLRDREGFLLAVLTLARIWEPDWQRLARAVYGTDDAGRHPGVAGLLAAGDRVCLAGPVEGIALPQHYDFPHLRRLPSQVRRLLAGRGRTMGFQDPNPLHVMHRETLLAVAAEHGATLFLSPLLPPAPFSATASMTTVRCYELFMDHLPPGSAVLGLTALRRHQAGPRGAMLQALVNRNHGCTHFLVHEHHDDPFPGPGAFYPQHAAYEALAAVQGEMGVVPVPFAPRRYVPAYSVYLPPGEIPDGVEHVAADHAAVVERLERGGEVPGWCAFSEVARELLRRHPPAWLQGFTLFLTGLSGAGKSTLAKVLFIMLQERQDRPVSLLDGDIVRRHLSSELTFSREHRNLNVQRIGYVASEITKNRGIAICAPIAPYPESRRAAREMVEAWGPFLEIHVSTPLAVCEGRDRKGLYAKARAGLISGVTGVDDPYLPPEHPELCIDTSECSPLEAAEIVLDYLEMRGLCAPGDRTA